MLRKAVLALSLIQVVGLTGCLEMRDDKKEVDEKVVMRRQVQTLQQSTADVNSRFNEVEDDTRKIHGQLAEDDQKIKQTNALMDKGFGMADTKFKERDQVYREEFTKLHADLDALKAQFAALQTQQQQAAAAALQAQADAAAANAKAAEAAKDPWATAEEKFEQKAWRDAILDYEKYRKTNPKGKNFAAATYKIGVCFQEMGSADDARAFFEEVISKFPKAKEAKSAAIRLKKLKK